MDFDVIVIGASTAGLYAAEELAREGKKVAVFERQAELNHARRTLIVTPAIRNILGAGPNGATLHETGTLALASRQHESLVRLADPDPIVERNELSQWLLARAQQAGAKTFFGYRFGGFGECNAGVHIHLENGAGKVSALARDAVMGADGVLSDVAKAAGIPRPPSVPILQAEVKLPNSWDPNVTKVWFDADHTRFFYWLIPESEKRGVVGLIGDHGKHIRELLKDFLARHGFSPEAYQGSQVAMHHPRLKPWTRIGRVPVFLIGDAAGQVKVTTVGGTVTGFGGARAAARAVLNGTSYKKELRRVKRELDVHWIIRKLLDRLDNHGYNRLIEAISPPVQKFLGRYDRDSMAPVVWRLLFLEKRLWTLAFHCSAGRARVSKPACVASE